MLGQEALIALIGTGLLALLSWHNLSEFRRTYLLRTHGQAENAVSLLEARISGGIRDLDHLGRISDSGQRAAVLPLLDRLSAIYLLDQKLRVRQVLKQQPHSRVFEGYTFGHTRLGAQLAATGGGSGVSPLLPAYEDERAGLYIWQQVGSDTLLGRVDLGYVQALLRDFSRVSGAPLLLTSREGFVMLSGSAQLPSGALAAQDWEAMARRGGTLDEVGRHWLPLAIPSHRIGALVVNLVPTEPLDSERRLLLGGAGAIAAAIGLLLALRHRVVRSQLVQPIASLAGQLEADAQGQNPASGPALPGSQLREIEAIQRFSKVLSLAVREREEGLRSAQRREQEATGRQRRELEENLRTGLSASAVAHEIQQPLSALVLSNHLIEEERRRHSNTPLAAALEPLVLAQRQEGERMVATIQRMRQLLDQQPGERQAVDLVELVNDCLESWSQQDGLPEDLQLESSGLNAPRWVWGDREELRLAIVNLLRHGQRAMAREAAEGGSARLAVAVDSGKEGVQLAVSDNGQAAQGELLRELPAPGQQRGALGLELYLAQLVAHRHGGHLSVGRSADGRARAVLHLPALPQGGPQAFPTCP